MTKNNPEKIKIGIIGGSGLDDPEILKDAKEEPVATPFGSPSGPLITGRIGNRDVVILARHGKGHTIPPTKVPFRANIWALKKAGCTHILATTACGSLKEEIRPKDFVFADQFIDWTKLRPLTFFEEEGRVVHTSMPDPFCGGLRKILAETAGELGIPHHKNGTIITIEGPRFSTRAESNLYRQFGADVINMSTVPEAALARELGLCYASIAMATDYDVWREGEKPVTFEIILAAMKTNSENAKRLLLKTIPKINFTRCKQCFIL